MPIQLLDRDQIVVSSDPFQEPPNRRSRFHDLLHRLKSVKIMKLPISHVAMLSVLVFSLLNFTRVYTKMYAKSRYFTTQVVNVLLFGISDTLAQSIQVFSRKAAHSVIHLPFNPYDQPRDEEYGVSRDTIFNDDTTPEFHDAHSDAFNFKRWASFVFWGWQISFFQVTWYIILNKLYTEDPSLVQVLERVLSDQLVYSPISLYCFFTYTGFIDGIPMDTTRKQLYVNTLFANWMLWPLVQFINFLVMPHSIQVPFSSSVGVLWNCYLSLTNFSRN